MGFIVKLTAFLLPISQNSQKWGGEMALVGNFSSPFPKIQKWGGEMGFSEKLTAFLLPISQNFQNGEEKWAVVRNRQRFSSPFLKMGRRNGR